jgi:hypothetical protein
LSPRGESGARAPSTILAVDGGIGGPMDIPVEYEEWIEPDDVVDEDDDDSTPEETKATFWGQIFDFIGTMLLGLPV